jgi:hypothetical protein
VYPASVAEVVAMLRDESATVEKYESMGHREVRILALDAGEDALTITSSRVVDVDLPGFAKKVLKPTNTMVQTDEWRRAGDDRWDGTFAVEVKGAPVRIAGTMRLTPDGDGCRHEVTIDFQVKVPIVGGKVADWAAKNDGQRTLAAEFAFNDQRLRTRGT